MAPIFFKLWIPSEYSPSLPWLSMILLLPVIIYSNMWTIYNYTIIINKIKAPSVALLIVGGVSSVLSVIYVKCIGRNIYVIPAITTFFSVAYYLFYIPIFVARKSSLTIGKIYLIIFKSIFIAFSFIFFSWFYLKPFLLIGGWFELVGFMVSFGLTGFVLHVLSIFSLFEIRSFLNRG